MWMRRCIQGAPTQRSWRALQSRRSSCSSRLSSSSPAPRSPDSPLPTWISCVGRGTGHTFRRLLTGWMRLPKTTSLLRSTSDVYPDTASRSTTSPWLGHILSESVSDNPSRPLPIPRCCHDANPTPPQVLHSNRALLYKRVLIQAEVPSEFKYLSDLPGQDLDQFPRLRMTAADIRRVTSHRVASSLPHLHGTYNGGGQEGAEM